MSLDIIQVHNYVAVCFVFNTLQSIYLEMFLSNEPAEGTEGMKGLTSC